MEIITKHCTRLIMKLLLRDDGKLRLWGVVLPWFLMACIAIVTVAYAYSLIK